MPRLFDLATTIRSKNAGVDHVTFDVIFTDRAAYERVRAATWTCPEPDERGLTAPGSR